MPESLTLENYRDAWSVGEMGGHFVKTVFIVLPALFLILFLSSWSRSSARGSAGGSTSSS